MTIAKEFKKIFQQLMHDSVAHLVVGGSDITIRVFEGGSMFSLSTDVYFGGNFIPKSVRSCITKQPPFTRDSTIKTFLTVDEPNFHIYLNFLGHLDRMNKESFRLILEEFGRLADEWHLYLDENDKNDLIYIHVKK
jgi:hypothetical protein